MEKKQTAASEAKRAIETFGAPEAVLAGLYAYHGWADGKMLTQSEFDTALKEYLEAPCGSFRGGKKL